MKDISTTYYTSNDQNCSALNGREIDQSELEDNAIAHSYMDAIYLYGHMLHETGYEQKNASLFLNQFRNKTVKFEAENKEIIMDINGDQATQFALYCANKKGFWSICLVGFSCITQLITLNKNDCDDVRDMCAASKTYVCVPTNRICHEHYSVRLFHSHETPF